MKVSEVKINSMIKTDSEKVLKVVAVSDHPEREDLKRLVYKDLENKTEDVFLAEDHYINDILNQVIGVEEAAQLWNLRPGYIKNLCNQGKVKAKKIGHTWVIDKNQPNPKSR